MLQILSQNCKIEDKTQETAFSYHQYRSVFLKSNWESAVCLHASVWHYVHQLQLLIVTKVYLL